MRRHNGSIDTTHTPTPLSFYNNFRIKVGCSYQGFGSGFNQVSGFGSGSSRTKMTPKRKKLRNFMF
jgi:hypothetical protein